MIARNRSGPGDENRGPAPSLAARVRELREKRGLTPAQLAEEAGVTKTHVWQIENGEREKMRMGTLEGYARALGVSVYYLWNGVEEGPATGNFPPTAVCLRHTTKLDDKEIRQIVDIIEGMELRRRLAKKKDDAV